MGNMAYCRFENTLNDLQDCFDALDEDSLIDYYDDSSEREKRSIIKLLQLIREFHAVYGPELEDLKEHRGKP